uniref:DNA polymerase alpha subunit B n=2 Tax=Caenorhabditis japonica TaxID=281687 RepID=A0A8R1HTX5_CAEJA
MLAPPSKNTICVSDDEEGTMVRLEFTKMLDDITLFPGQIIAVRGTNSTGEELQVDRIYTAPPLPVTKVEIDTSKDIWFASGPYTAVDNCGYEHLCELLDKVVLEKPDILILAGPFIDRRNTYLNKPSFTMTYDDLLEDLLMKIKQKLVNTKTEVIIQPSSSRDLCVPPVFPSAPFQVNRKKLNSIKKDILFVPDPCVLRIEQKGIEIAVTSSEPIQGLSNLEFHRSANQENNDRFARLNSHLLTQQSLYPLEPTDVPSAMGDLLEVCRLTATPNIIFSPSKLVPSVQSVNGCVFVNSSSLAKGPTGNYVKISINMSAGELKPEESVADYSLVQIMRI